MANCECNKKIIYLRQGDDSNFNGNKIIFNIKSGFSLQGWKAIFQLQDFQHVFNDISTKRLELEISQKDTDKLEPGTFYGWLKLYDENDKQGTVFVQQFCILKRRVL